MPLAEDGEIDAVIVTGAPYWAGLGFATTTIEEDDALHKPASETIRAANLPIVRVHPFNGLICFACLSLLGGLRVLALVQICKKVKLDLGIYRLF